MNEFEVRTIKKDKMFGTICFGSYRTMKEAEKKAAFVMASASFAEERSLGLEIVELVPVTRKVLVVD